MKRISFLLNSLLLWQCSISFHVYLIRIYVTCHRATQMVKLFHILKLLMICLGLYWRRLYWGSQYRSFPPHPTPPPEGTFIPQRLDTPRAISKLCSVVLIHALCRLAVILLCTVFHTACSVLPQGGLRYA